MRDISFVSAYWMGGDLKGIDLLTLPQDREATRSSEVTTPPPKTQDANISMDNEKLRSFFSNLVNKGPSNSPRGA